MDNFGVPKKINRHVLKALYYMHDCGYDNPDISEICESVEFTMKNNVPVRDLPSVVRQSLQNMAQLGVIERNGSNFFVRNTDLSAIQNNYNTKIFRINERQHDRKRVEPFSRNSMTSNGIEKIRKRSHLSTPIARKSIRIILPKIKLSNKKFYMNADVEQVSLPSKDRYMAQEPSQKNTCPISTTLRIPFCSGVSETEMEQDIVAPPAQQPNNGSKSNLEKGRSNHNINNQTNNVPDPPPKLPKKKPDSEEVVTAEQKVETKMEHDSTGAMSSNVNSIDKKPGQYP